MGVDTSLQYNGYNSYKFNQNDFLICYPFGVENMEYITHSFGAYSPIGLGSKVRAKTRFFNADGGEIKLENHSFAVQQGTFDKVEITVSVPVLAVKAELTFLNNEAQPWWVATPKTEEGQTATPYAINAYGQLTYITPNGIYTGTITANQIVLASGGSLPDRLTKINANGVYTGEIVADQVDFDGATGNNVNLTGNITATSGKIGGYDISGDNLIGNDVTLGQNNIKIGDANISSELISGMPNTLSIESRYMNLGRLNPNDSTRIFAGTKSFVTVFDNVIRLGGSGDNALDFIHLKNQPDVSSDISLKTQIQSIPKDLIEYLKEVKPKMFKMDNKWHFGYIAQDVEKALLQYAETKVDKKEAKNYIKDFPILNDDGQLLSLLYGEIAVLKEKEMQDRINDLENRLLKLENLLKEGDK